MNSLSITTPVVAGCALHRKPGLRGPFACLSHRVNGRDFLRLCGCCYLVARDRQGQEQGQTQASPPPGVFWQGSLLRLFIDYEIIVLPFGVLFHDAAKQATLCVKSDRPSTQARR
ncbi:MAG: hypothetical protein CVT62_05815 [Actinobacteria bacterium HGW-Actinobacteria-2]|nr:MAG: hypothetical protein CVT62_05815 [Actinobacteria bacterium HGW-Actinobacteria-2]